MTSCSDMSISTESSRYDNYGYSNYKRTQKYNHQPMTQWNHATIILCSDASHDSRKCDQSMIPLGSDCNIPDNRTIYGFQKTQRIIRQKF